MDDDDVTEDLVKDIRSKMNDREVLGSTSSTKLHVDSSSACVEHSSNIHYMEHHTLFDDLVEEMHTQSTTTSSILNVELDQAVLEGGPLEVDPFNLFHWSSPTFHK
mgnify:FL=1